MIDTNQQMVLYQKIEIGYHMKKLIALTFLSLLILAGCMNKPDIIYVGEVRDQIAAFPLHFAVEADFYPRDKIQFRKYSSEEKLFEALKKGSVDLAALPASWAMLDDTKTIGIIQPLQRGGGGIVTSSKIDSLEQLHGAKIGVLISSQLADITQALNEKGNYGWNLILYESKKKLFNAFNDGEIDAFTRSTPDIVGYSGYYKVIHWFTEDFGYYPAFSLLANEASLELKKQDIDDYIQKVNDGINLINLTPNDTYTNFSRVCQVVEYYSREILRQTRYIKDPLPNDEHFEDLMGELSAARRGIQNHRTYWQSMIK